jgi:Tfp pilus assembly protein PilF
MKRPSNNRILATLLTAAFVMTAGCTSLTTLKRDMAEQPPRRQERKEQVVATFEAQREAAQLQAALNRFSEGNHDACFQQLSNLVQTRPAFVDARLQLAELHLFRGEHQQAQQQLRAALIIAPQRAELHDCLGRALEADAQSEEALVHFQKAAEIEPANELYAARSGDRGMRY